ncbi:MAG: DNA adenine methylase [Firmicutes bacterium]|nr:DNA adenine methylase [Bacillota bacterium]
MNYINEQQTVNNVMNSSDILNNVGNVDVLRYSVIENSKERSLISYSKPFLKWAGGKGQLLKEIRKHYPFDNCPVNKYAEPFVGGGAVLFDILNMYKLEKVYISDINQILIDTYTVIRDDVFSLIVQLNKLQDEFIPLNTANRKDYYLSKRKEFNKIINSKEKILMVERAALMIFLNKTCFNGLYRVNKKGEFNVPMGAYKSPLICDIDNLLAVSDKLKNVEINCADYRESSNFIDDKTFVYIDPPYRPLTKTANFTSYTSTNFDDKEQIELANFVNDIDLKGAKILISNSDPKNTDKDDNFFDELYSSRKILRIDANRMINSKADNRGRISELLISNF